MAFNRRDWANGERITEALLDNLEDRIEQGLAEVPVEVTDPLVSTLVDDDFSTTTSSIKARVEGWVADGTIPTAEPAALTVTETAPGSYALESGATSATIYGLTASQKLPSAAKSDLSTDITTTGTAIRAALETAGLGVPDDAKLTDLINDDASATAGAVLGLVRENTGVTVLPTGDTTGNQDTVRINEALTNSDVILRGMYYTNNPLTIPSHRTLTLHNATIKLVPGSNCNVVRNRKQDTTGDDNVSLVGIGRAVIDAGNASTQTTASAYNAIGVTFTHVRGLKVNGLSIGPCRGPAMVVQGITDGLIESIHINHDRTNNNQDGIDVGPSCDGVTIRGITGVTEDDGFAIFATPTAGFAHPMYKGTDAPVTGIKNVTISDVALNVGIHPVRLQAADPLFIENVRISNYRNTNPETSIYAVMVFGPVTTWTPAPKEKLRNITLSGYQGPGNVIISAETKFSYVDVSDVTLTGPWKTFLGTEQASENYAADVEYVTFDNVRTTESSGYPSLLNTAPGGTYASVTVTNVRARRIGALLNNAGTLTNLFMSNINIGSVGSALIASSVPETGQIDNVFVQYTAASTLYTTAATKLRLGPNMPLFRSGDVTPANTRGSIITCRAGKDPTGGTSTTGGQYINNGSGWVKTADLGAGF